MKKILKKIGKIFVAIFLIGTVCIVTVGLIFGVKGYFMYREALDETPLAEKVEEIQQQHGKAPPHSSSWPLSARFFRVEALSWLR